MRLTREQTIKKHRKMWNWIADKIKEAKCRQDIDRLKREYCFDRGQPY